MGLLVVMSAFTHPSHALYTFASHLGTLSFVIHGPNPFCSFLFVLLSYSHRLDGRHVVFGEVLEGMDVVKMIEGLGSNDGTVKTPVVIADSGELK